MVLYLSFRKALKLAHALYKFDCISFDPKIHVDFFISSEVHVKSNFVDQLFAEKCYPLIMGEHAYYAIYHGDFLPF